jgi:ComF family protein
MMAAMWRVDPALCGTGGVLVPVPQRFWKERRRGYNPAALLASTLGRELRLPVLRRALRKVRWTPDQAALSTAQDRRSNLIGAFRVRPRFRHTLKGRVVLLVDDILTTGATAGECSRVLLRQGTREVVVLTVARTARSGPGAAGPV